MTSLSAPAHVLLGVELLRRVRGVSPSEFRETGILGKQ